MMNVLLIEDDDVVRPMLEEQIQLCGYDVTACVNAEIGFNLYQQSAYSLIVLDLGLPGLDGPEFCHRIRFLPQGSYSSILLITERDKLGNLRAALDAGADDYIVKPIHQEMFQARLTIIARQLQNLTQHEQAVILVVDDDAEILKLLCKYLETLEFKTFVAQSGEQALQQLEYIIPDLILLDILMPGVDGFETCHRLKNNHKTRHIPVIFMTARTDIEDKIKGFEVGGVDYITKPFQYEEVIARIKTHLALRNLQKQCQRKNARLQREIAVRQWAEETLQKKEARFRSIVQDQVDLVCRYLSDSTLTFVNDAYCRYYSKRPEELIGKKFLTMIPPEDRPKIAANIALLCPENPVVQMENRILLPNGETRWHHWINRIICDEHGHVSEYQGTGRDITERKLAEEALQVSEQQYRSLADSVAEAIVIVQNRHIVFANHPLCVMLGYTAGEFSQLALSAFIPEGYEAEYTKQIECVEQQRGEQNWQIPCLTKNGQEIWIETRHNFIQWEGSPAILITARDITEAKQREFVMEEEKEQLKKVNIALKSSLKERYKFGNIIGKSQVMQHVYELIASAAASDANVVIYGESGTGKELVAWTIHSLSARKEKAFVPVNCSAIPETLFEREFFGHRKGAFTGAYSNQEGYFDAAHHGTLFLDEIGELRPMLQAKLLRVIEDGMYRPVGDKTLRQANVRLIAATHQNLNEQLQQGIIREDFFYRLHVIPITLPPLRDRKDDLPLLVDFFLKKYHHKAQPVHLSGEMLDMLYKYDWPGNVRELQNVLQRYLTTKQLDFIHNHRDRSDNLAPLTRSEFAQDTQELQSVMAAFERQFISYVLGQNGWHRGRTAKKLGITRRSLHRKMTKYQLRPLSPEQ